MQGGQGQTKCILDFIGGLRILIDVMRWYLSFFALALLSGCSSGDYVGYKYKPYNCRGVHYEPIDPRDAPGYVEEGVASHYNETKFFIFPGKTAIGENMWFWTSCGAHKTLPLPCRVKVTNLKNGRSTVVRINDRGPFIGNRILDVTEPVAKKLGFYDAGLTHVRIQVLSVGDGKYRIKKARVVQPPVMPAGLPVERAVPVAQPFNPYDAGADQRGVQ